MSRTCDLHRPRTQQKHSLLSVSLIHRYYCYSFVVVVVHVVVCLFVCFPLDSQATISLIHNTQRGVRGIGVGVGGGREAEADWDFDI